MKNFSVCGLLASCSLLTLASPAMAGGFTNSITDAVKLDVLGAGVQTVRTGSSYAVSGSNVTATIGGLSNVGAAATYSGTAPATVTSSSALAIMTPGSSFSFSESAYVGDTVVNTAYTAGATTGLVDPRVYGNSTVSTGGVKGTLAGSLTAGTAAAGVGSITAGGAGTSATLQRTIDLTVFQ